MKAAIPVKGDLVSMNDFSGKSHTFTVHDTTIVPIRRKGKKTLKVVPIVGDNVLDIFVEDMKFRNRHKYDNIVAFTGGERVGKSHAAARVAMMLDSTFNIDRVVFNTELLPEIISNLEPGQCVIVDEAGKEINNRNWAKSSQKELVTKFQVFGKKRVNIFLVSPRFSYIDSAIRDTRLFFWVQVKARKNGAERGYITVKEVERDDYSNDNWWNTNYAGKINPPSDYPELDEFMKQYEEKKDKYIQEILMKPEKEPEPEHMLQRNKLIWFILKCKILTLRELTVLTGLKTETTRKIKKAVEEEIDDETKELLGLGDE